MNVDAAVKLKMEYTLKALGLAPSALLQPLSDAAALGCLLRETSSFPQRSNWDCCGGQQR